MGDSITLYRPPPAFAAASMTLTISLAVALAIVLTLARRALSCRLDRKRWADFDLLGAMSGPGDHPAKGVLQASL